MASSLACARSGSSRTRSARRRASLFSAGWPMPESPWTSSFRTGRSWARRDLEETGSSISRTRRFEGQPFGCSRPPDLPLRARGIRQRPGVAFRKAWERSACNSPRSSIPTESRTSEGVSPTAACSSSGMSAWVIVDGWVMSDSTPPRLSARRMVFNALRKAGTAFRRFSSNEMTEPAPTPGRSAIPSGGGPAGPGSRFSRRRGVRQEPRQDFGVLLGARHPDGEGLDPP